VEFAIVALLGLLLALWFAGEPALLAWRRGRIRRRPFPAAWRAILRERVPFFLHLPADLQLQLKRHIHVFIAEKRFVGCAGLDITDEMRVTIAAQACLLLLNRRTDYFARLREVLVYPGPYLVDSVQGDGSGVLHERREARSGESWTRGQVVLSWDDALAGAADPEDGRNVVIHEFAHQLDQEKGHANGAPWLGSRMRHERWSRVLGDAFARTQAQSRRDDGTDEPLLIDPYAATSPAEFFAIVSEVFFERPQRLAAEQPALYREFSRFYRIDPLSW
jgi:Mlc titration factor MtfA (ptsG expression regulator)